MKSYLSGNPELKLALNEEIVVGKSNAPTGGPTRRVFSLPRVLFRLTFGSWICRSSIVDAGGYGVLEIDDCNFHEVVKLDDWEALRILSFVPPGRVLHVFDLCEWCMLWAHLFVVCTL